ncbi:hypothetical protein LzC2_05620 [Planctomycetes bacterium LzC2]|uniref:Uncharacterized protein n=1 Tax=Alienimonas chondri TaxID=2681879 RepID=A0ABX1V8P4_9PLAN|nr:hypothetical protein [Alienimonas chondri]
MVVDPRRDRLHVRPGADRGKAGDAALFKPNRHQPDPPGNARGDRQQQGGDRGAVGDQQAFQVDHRSRQQAQQHRRVQGEGERRVPRALERPSHVRQEQTARRRPRSPVHDFLPEQPSEQPARRQFDDRRANAVPQRRRGERMRPQEPADHRQLRQPPTASQGRFVRGGEPEAAQLIAQSFARSEPDRGDVHKPTRDAAEQENADGQCDPTDVAHESADRTIRTTSAGGSVASTTTVDASR